MLRAIISPAKKMVPGAESFAARSVPALSGRAEQLLRAVGSLGDDELQRLWKVSDRLLEPCLEDLGELRRRGLPKTEEDLVEPGFSGRVSPAVFAYAGIQYQSMAPGVMTEREIAWLREHMRIISGFYGCLRPFDAVLPYRLEMGARLAVGGARDLYGFWGDGIAREVCRAEADDASEGVDKGRNAGLGETSDPDRPDRRGKPGPVGGAVDPKGPVDGTVDPKGPVHVVNLASAEYSKAVLPHLKKLGAPCTTCIFGEELRKGRPVQRSTASKTARGSFVRWMAQNGIDDVRDLTSFDVGYTFAPELSKDDLLVFMRA